MAAPDPAFTQLPNAACRRLWIAYLVSPWGALIPIGAVWLVALFLAATTSPSDDSLRLIEILRVKPWQTWLWPVGAGYAIGALLVPLYFAFERGGRRGWSYYVPTAIVAGLMAPIAVSIVRTAWFVAVASHTESGGIGAVSVGVAQSVVETLGTAACATGCAAVFAVLVREK